MSKFTIVTCKCRNRYDHNENLFIDLNTDYAGSIHDPDNSTLKGHYTVWVDEQGSRADCGWVSVTEVELTTGLSTLIAYKANPIMERKELNKEAKIRRASRKISTGDFLYPQGFFSNTSVPIPPAILQAMNVAQTSEEDEEEESEPVNPEW